jgi:hypothetical protein
MTFLFTAAFSAAFFFPATSSTTIFLTAASSVAFFFATSSVASLAAATSAASFTAAALVTAAASPVAELPLDPRVSLPVLLLTRQTSTQERLEGGHQPLIYPGHAPSSASAAEHHRRMILYHRY